MRSLFCVCIATLLFSTKVVALDPYNTESFIGEYVWQDSEDTTHTKTFDLRPSGNFFFSEKKSDNTVKRVNGTWEYTSADKLIGYSFTLMKDGNFLDMISFPNEFSRNGKNAFFRKTEAKKLVEYKLTKPTL